MELAERKQPQSAVKSLWSFFPFLLFRADVMTDIQTGIQLSDEAWAEGRMILTEEQSGELRRQMEAFLHYIGI